MGTVQTSPLFVSSADRDWTHAEDGVRRKVLGYDDHMMMVCVEFETNAKGTLHAHPHRQVTFVESGSFDVVIGGEKRVLRSGDCFFVPPDTQHGVVAREKGRLIDVFTPARQDFI
jgi:quercetin dioxygenase-like cupin family protein